MKKLIAIALLLAASLLLAVSSRAGVQGAVIVTNLPTNLAGNTGATTNPVTFIPIIDNRGLAFSFAFNTLGGLSTNVGLSFQPSVDGVTLVNSQVWPLSLASNLYYASATSTLTNACVATNWTAAQLYGYTAVALVWVTNYNATAITNINAVARITSN